VRIEAQIRQAIRDAVNRNSRKPFYWGGLAGYQQLEAIGQALHQATAIDPESDYLRQLIGRVDRVLAKNHTLAEDLQAAHQWLQQIADCLRYPPHSRSSESQTALKSQQVAWEIEELMRQFHPTGRHQQAQIRLYNALQKRWGLYAQELLFCYDIPGLPRITCKWKRCLGVCGATSAALAGANRPANCVTLDKLRFSSWQTVRRIGCGKSARFRQPFTESIANTWQRQKRRANSCAAYTMIR